MIVIVNVKKKEFINVNKMENKKFIPFNLIYIGICIQAGATFLCVCSILIFTIDWLVLPLSLFRNITCRLS